MAAALQILLFHVCMNLRETKHPVHLIHRNMFPTICTSKTTPGKVDYIHVSYPCLKQLFNMVKAFYVVHSNSKRSFIRIDSIQKQIPKNIAFHLFSYKGFWALCHSLGCPDLIELNMSPTTSPAWNNVTSFVGESPASYHSPSFPPILE